MRSKVLNSKPVSMTDQEINEAVARKLGWTCDPDQERHKPPYRLWSHKDGRVVTALEIPNYCGSIEAAWEIVEYWLNSKIGFRTFALRRSNTSYWYAQFQQENNYKIYDQIDAICPMAIALAFIKIT